MIRAALVLALSFGLAACGFQLRGSEPVAGREYPPVYLQQAHSDNAMRRRISQQLAIHNIPTVETKAAARYVALISEIERSDTVLTLDSDARAAERLLIIGVALELQNADRQTLQSQRVREQRVLFTDPENPVGSGTESQLVINELEEASARRVALQLTRWLEKADQNATATGPAR